MDTLRKEFIGFKIEIVDALNPCLIGLKGRVVDETKNTLVIEDDRERRLIKDQIRFEIKMEGTIYRFDGSLIRKRPEERVKLR